MLSNLSTQAQAATCNLEPGPTHTVTRVEAAGSLILDDGREVVLIGALQPVAREHTSASNSVLKALVEGRPVELAFSGRRLDRYGRLLAHVFVQSDQQRTWVQGHLIQGGHARAYSLPGHTACLDELFALEQSARQNKLALWGQAQFQDRDANDVRSLLRYRDTFQSVVGRIENVIKVRGETVLVFSGDGLAGFNATIARAPPADKAAFKFWNDFKHKAVRVRGWIDQRRGPSITLNDAREVEQLDLVADQQSQQSPNAPPPIPVIAPAP